MLQTFTLLGYLLILNPATNATQVFADEPHSPLTSDTTTPLRLKPMPDVNPELHVARPYTTKEAYTWSLAGTLIPLGVSTYSYFHLISNSQNSSSYEGANTDFTSISISFALGAIIGPSFGEFYTGAVGNGFSGIGLRLSAVGLGLALAFPAAYNNSGAFEIPAAGFLAYGVARSFMRIPAEVRNANVKASAKRAYLFQVSPEFALDNNHQPVVGARAWLSY